MPPTNSLSETDSILENTLDLATITPRFLRWTHWATAPSTSACLAWEPRWMPFLLGRAVEYAFIFLHHRFRFVSGTLGYFFVCSSNPLVGNKLPDHSSFLVRTHFGIHLLFVCLSFCGWLLLQKKGCLFLDWLQLQWMLFSCG